LPRAFNYEARASKCVDICHTNRACSAQRSTHVQDVAVGSSEAPNPQTTQARSNEVRNRLLALLAVLVVMLTMRVTRSVSAPFAFSMFLIAVCWPLYCRVAQHLPRGIAAIAALVAFLACVGAIFGGLWYSAQVLGAEGPKYQAELDRAADGVRNWLEQHGVPAPQRGAGLGLSGQAISLSRSLFDFLGSTVLVCAFLVLGLLEVREYEQRLKQSLPVPYGKWKRVITGIARDFQRYVVVRTFIGGLSWIGQALICLAVGVPHAFIWGLLAFLLNYIPTLGSIIAVLPPALFALVSGGGVSRALGALVALGTFQLVLGNWLDPILQGKYLKLSPVVVLLSIVFWGWVWGVAGAFMAMPLTILIVLLCREFESTRWISTLLAEVDTPKRPRHRALFSRRHATTHGS
jgi:AI-2 transport protein TqsA